MSLVGEIPNLVLDFEMYNPKVDSNNKDEGEINAAKRLLLRVSKEYRNVVDIVTYDALACNPKFLNCCIEAKVDAVIRVKKNNNNSIRQIKRTVNKKEKAEVWNNKTEIIEVYEETFYMTGVEQPLRYVKFAKKKEQKDRSQILIVTTCLDIPLKRLYKIIKARWHIENRVFNNLKTDVQIYTKDIQSRLKQNTWRTKEVINRKKILPYFGSKKVNEILPKDIIAWQNKMIEYRDDKGKPYSPTYLKTLHNQLSAIFNHAVRFYDLKSNPAAKAGNMGKEKNREMLFWIKEEYLKFSDSMMDKPLSFYAFEMLYWCGIRSGELLALTAADFDLNKGTVHINKSYQRIKREDIVTEPKTPKSNRTIAMPNFLTEEMEEYISMMYGADPTDRIFPITKSYLHHEMTRGSKEQGIKRIRVHDLRHSHVSMLIEMGFSAVDIANRMGHESIDITFRYAHMFPSKQKEMANRLDMER